MIHKMSKRVLKRLPPSICKAAEQLQKETLNCGIQNISVAELTRIMSVLFRTGKSSKEIVDLLIETVNGEENILSNFVNTYPRRVENPFIESFVMFAFGFIISILLFRGLVYKGLNVVI